MTEKEWAGRGLNELLHEVLREIVKSQARVFMAAFSRLLVDGQGPSLDDGLRLFLIH